MSPISLLFQILQKEPNSSSFYSPNEMVTNLTQRKEQCETQLSSILESDPVVKFMLSALERSGCPFQRKNFACITCHSATYSGGFEPQIGISICSNTPKNSDQDMKSLLVHELVHAYDYCRADIDMTNLRHMACTEVRAAMLSGDCDFKKELYRGTVKLKNGFQECVKRRAALSIAHNPKCIGGMPHARTVVDQVFPSCFSDTDPFIDIP